MVIRMFIEFSCALVFMRRILVCTRTRSLGLITSGRCRPQRAGQQWSFVGESGYDRQQRGSPTRCGSSRNRDSVTSKPAHLAPEYADQFKDESVVAAYHTRPPYPESVFDILESLAPDLAGPLLDLGCGTGEIAIPMSRRLWRVVAVDASLPMLQMAKSRGGQEADSIEWVNLPAEEFAYPETYGVVVAAASLH